jgi:CRP/FNR family cyclic AMP-dependent transcriptional regulator
MARSEIDDTIARIPIFSACSKKELKEISRLLSSLVVKAGDKLTEQGHRGNEFMIIERGTATVLRDGKEIGKLGPADFFGELAMLAEAPRTATVVADQEMVVWTVSRQEFSSMLRQNQSIAMSVLTSAVKRLYADNLRSIQ